MTSTKLPVGRVSTASILVLLAGSVCTQAATGPRNLKTWDDEADDNLWFTGANWDPDGVPGAGDDVEMSAPEVVTVQTGGVDVKSIICNTGLRLAGLSFITTNGTDPSAITNLVIETCCVTDIRNNGLLNIQGFSEWSEKPVFYGPGLVQLLGFVDANAGITLDETAPVFVLGDAFVQGNITIQDVSTLTVSSGGQLTMQVGEIQTFDDGLFVIDGGTLARVAPFSSQLTAKLEMSSGVIRSEVGTLDIRSEFDITGGALEASNDGLLQVYGTSAMPERVLGVTEYRGDGGIVLRANPTILSNAATNLVDSNQGLQFRLATHLQQTLTNQGRLVMFGVDVTADDNAAINNLGTTEFLGGVDLDAPFWNTGTAEILTNMGVGRELANFEGEMILQGPTGGLKPIFDQPAGSLVIEGGVFRMSTDFDNYDPQVTIPLSHNGGQIVNEGPRCDLRFFSGGEFADGSVVRVGGTGASDRSSVQFVGGEPYLFNGQVSFVGTGAVAVGGQSGTLTPIVVNGSMNNGVIDLAASNQESGAYLRGDVSGSGQVFNQGRLYLGGGLSLDCALVNSMDVFVQGSQTWSSIITNSGLLRHNTDAQVIFDGCVFDNTGIHQLSRNQLAAGPLGGDYLNNGTVEFESVFFGTTSVDVPFENNGTVIADAVVVMINVPEQVSEGTLAGGSWMTLNSGRIEFPNSLITGAEGCGIEGDGDSLPWLEGVEMLRSCDAKLGDLACDSSLSLDDECAVSLEPNASVSTPGSFSSTGGSSTSLAPGSELQAGTINIGEPDALPSVVDTIEGVVQLARSDRGGPLIAPVVEANLVNIYGRISPASDGEGELEVRGALTLHENAELSVSVSASGDADRLTVVDPEPARLAGTVSVDVADIGAIQPSDSFLIVQSDSGFIGSFDAIEVDGGERSLVPRLIQSATTVSLVFTCQGDVSGDGVVDLADLNAVLGNFGFEGSAGDANGDGVVNLDDLNAVLGIFGEDCE